jgi:hypothetical protein
MLQPIEHCQQHRLKSSAAAARSSFQDASHQLQGAL